MALPGSQDGAGGRMKHLYFVTLDREWRELKASCAGVSSPDSSSTLSHQPKSLSGVGVGMSAPNASSLLSQHARSGKELRPPLGAVAGQPTVMEYVSPSEHQPLFRLRCV